MSVGSCVFGSLDILLCWGPSRCQGFWLTKNSLADSYGCLLGPNWWFQFWAWSVPLPFGPPKQPIFLGLGASDWTGRRQNLTWSLKLMAPFFCLKNGHLWRRSISSRFLRSVTDFGHDKTCQNLHPNLPESCKEVASRADAFERFFRGHQTTQPVTDFLPHKTKTHCWESKSAFGTDPGYQKISLKSPKIKKKLGTSPASHLPTNATSGCCFQPLHHQLFLIRLCETAAWPHGRRHLGWAKFDIFGASRSCCFIQKSIAKIIKSAPKNKKIWVLSSKNP